MTDPSLLPSRKLEVHADLGLVGHLQEQNNLWTFLYAESWRRLPGAFALAPSLPSTTAEHRDGASSRPVQWFFDNLLPEAQARTYWAGKARIDENDAFAMLTHYGRESVGALTLLEPGQHQAPPLLSPLSEDLLRERIRALPAMAQGQAAPKRMSIAGAQYKFAVVVENGELYDPEGSWPSTHLIKPNSKEEIYPNSAINEWFVMRLAKACGFEVANVEFRAQPDPHIVVERFDRQRQGMGAPSRRRHMLDGCQLLSIDHSAKYRAATVEALRRIADLCAGKIATRLKLFDWLVFNALVGNDDNHLKNLSFFSGGTGYLLTPSYDLLSTGVYRILRPGELIHSDWRIQSELVFPIGQAQNFKQLRIEDFEMLGQELSITAARAKKRVQDLARLVFTQSQKLLQETSETERADGQPLNGGELRLLRQIHYAVIQIMCQQLLGR